MTKMSDVILERLAKIDKALAELKQRDVARSSEPVSTSEQGAPSEVAEAEPRKTKTAHRRVYPDELQPDGTFAPLPDQNEWIDEFTRRGDEFKGMLPGETPKQFKLRRWRNRQIGEAAREAFARARRQAARRAGSVDWMSR